MILYDYWRSSSAWRVRIALAWKGLAVERRVVNLLDGGQHDPAFLALNPSAQVPVLVVDDKPGKPFAIAQSAAILAYLEERYPTAPLLPQDVVLRARARQLAEIVNSGIQPFQNLATQERLRAVGLPDVRAWTKDCIGRGLAILERLAVETSGAFLVGDAPTWADVYLVPQLYGARRHGVDLGPFPTLVRAEASCDALPAFRGAHPDAQADAPEPPSKI